MSERERFEAWYEEYFGYKHPAPNVLGNHAHLWDAWQAALKAQPTAEAVRSLEAEVEALRSMLREVADDICVKHCLGPEHIARIDAALRGKESNNEPPMRICPLCHNKRDMLSVDAINADGSLVNPKAATCFVCDGNGWIENERGEGGRDE